MSHITVLVIGPDHEAALAPFNENREVVPYFVPMSAEQIAKRSEPTAIEMAHVHEREEWDENVEGRAVVIDGVPGLMSTHNLQGFWDWYSVGGRWAGYFPLKQGAGLAMLGVPGYSSPRGWVPCSTVPVGLAAQRAIEAQLAAYRGQTFGSGDHLHFEEQAAKYKARPRADIVRLGDVDFDLARNEAEALAREAFAQWTSVFTVHGQPEAWATIRDRMPQAYGTAREVYSAQPAIGAWQKTEAGRWGDCPVAMYGFDVEAYVAKQRAAALRPYAYVLDGKWRSRGDKVAEWSAEIDALYASLPPDTLLTLVDCHS